MCYVIKYLRSIYKWGQKRRVHLVGSKTLDMPYRPSNWILLTLRLIPIINGFILFAPKGQMKHRLLVQWHNVCCYVIVLTWNYRVVQNEVKYCCWTARKLHLKKGTCIQAHFRFYQKINHPAYKYDD